MYVKVISSINLTNFVSIGLTASKAHVTDRAADIQADDRHWTDYNIGNTSDSFHIVVEHTELTLRFHWVICQFYVYYNTYYVLETSVSMWSLLRYAASASLFSDSFPVVMVCPGYCSEFLPTNKRNFRTLFIMKNIREITSILRFD